MANDIGFKRTPEGTYKAYVSDYDSSATFPQAAREKVAQDYAVRVAERTLVKDGWSVTKQRLSDGSVKLVGVEKQLVKAKNW
jgi:hypothetical protein